MPVLNQKQELAKKADLLTKQDILTPGTGITIQNNVISATGTGGSTVSVTPVLSTGTRIAAMEVDGTIYTLFAPTPPSVGVTQVVDQGVELARVTINGVATSIYAPEGSTVLSGTSAPSSSLGEDNNLYVQYTVENESYTVDMTYVKLNGEWVELSAGGGGGGNVDDVYVNGTSVLDSDKIAQITSYREVTQAEYDALPASKESDGVLYCIKDKATADITVAPIIYSEEEREVGVWTDGKPLYQKTFSVSNITVDSWQSITHSISNLSEVVKFGGDFQRNSDGAVFSVPYYEAGSVYIAIQASSTLIYYKVNGITTGKINVTIQYTKTTDTPGSGKYAPSGVPAVHYSEEEQIVGTWIDGKPLYERTLSGTFSSQDSMVGYLYTGYFDISTIGTVDIVLVDSSKSYITKNGVNRGFVGGYAEAERNRLLMITYYQQSSVTAYITIQYTKQTS